MMLRRCRSLANYRFNFGMAIGGSLENLIDWIGMRIKELLVPEDRMEYGTGALLELAVAVLAATLDLIATSSSLPTCS